MAATNGTEATHAPEQIAPADPEHQYQPGDTIIYQNARYTVILARVVGSVIYLQVEGRPDELIRAVAVQRPLSKEDRIAATAARFAEAQEIWKNLPAPERCPTCSQALPRNPEQIQAWHLAHMDCHNLAADLVIDGICTAAEAARLIEEKESSVANVAALRAARRKK